MPKSYYLSTSVCDCSPDSTIYTVGVQRRLPGCWRSSRVVVRNGSNTIFSAFVWNMGESLFAVCCGFSQHLHPTCMSVHFVHPRRGWSVPHWSAAACCRWPAIVNVLIACSRRQSRAMPFYWAALRSAPVLWECGNRLYKGRIRTYLNLCAHLYIHRKGSRHSAPTKVQADVCVSLLLVILCVTVRLVLWRISGLWALVCVCMCVCFSLCVFSCVLMLVLACRQRNMPACTHAPCNEHRVCWQRRVRSLCTRILLKLSHTFSFHPFDGRMRDAWNDAMLPFYCPLSPQQSLMSSCWCTYSTVFFVRRLCSLCLLSTVFFVRNTYNGLGSCFARP